MMTNKTKDNVPRHPEPIDAKDVSGRAAVLSILRLEERITSSDLKRG